MGHVAKNHLTNWDTLGQLIKKYNDKLTSAERLLYSVDSKVVDTRDALAHGRLIAPNKGFPLTLWRFGEPDQSGKVPVKQVVELSEQWFETKRKLVMDQIERIFDCAKSRNYKSLA